MIIIGKLEKVNKEQMLENIPSQIGQLGAEPITCRLPL
jgi:hypothetical protein